jgi:hypothetical protein
MQQRESAQRKVRLNLIHIHALFTDEARESTRRDDASVRPKLIATSPRERVDQARVSEE